MQLTSVECSRSLLVRPAAQGELLELRISIVCKSTLAEILNYGKNNRCCGTAITRDVTEMHKEVR